MFKIQNGALLRFKMAAKIGYYAQLQLKMTLKQCQKY